MKFQGAAAEEGDNQFPSIFLGYGTLPISQPLGVPFLGEKHSNRGNRHKQNAPGKGEERTAQDHFSQSNT